MQEQHDADFEEVSQSVRKYVTHFSTKNEHLLNVAKGETNN